MACLMVGSFYKKREKLYTLPIDWGYQKNNGGFKMPNQNSAYGIIIKWRVVGILESLQKFHEKYLTI